MDSVAGNEHHTWFFKPEVPSDVLPGMPSEYTGQAQGADMPPDGAGMSDSTDRVVMHDGPSFEQVLAAYSETDRVSIDVRPLPMPQPMETILATLSTMNPNQALYVQHKRVPLFLLEELADQAYTAHIYDAGEGDVRMVIVRYEI